ncbi:uncharacterized protein [Spinacia oleracea]|uniref:DUF674 domain-containing protein n=1 Tax=Spinacia oleracea TaxID=3562 RepID=A0A9R0JG88_SPIOL|nr:uncharacterized protein LOC110806196 [Spinacia oleracea]
MAQKVAVLKLKMMVDVKAKKVVFAESGKEFVDFLFDIMNLPLATVVKLLNAKDMVGCLGELYKSIETLDTGYFEGNQNKDSVLKPSTAVVVPLLSLKEFPTTIKYSKCKVPAHKCISDYPSAICPVCRSEMSESSFTYVTPKTSSSNTYVKGPATYMVMDNLAVKPMSIALIKSHVEDFDKLEEKEVQVGLQEGLAILKASFETDMVLTNVFLGKKIKGCKPSSS